MRVRYYLAAGFALGALYFAGIGCVTDSTYKNEKNAKIQGRADISEEAEKSFKELDEEIESLRADKKGKSLDVLMSEMEEKYGRKMPDYVIKAQKELDEEINKLRLRKQNQ